MNWRTAILSIGWVSFLTIMWACNDGRDIQRPAVQLRIFLSNDLSVEDSVSLMNYLLSQPYVSELEYFSKEEAKKLYLADGGEDWSEVLDENPLPNSLHIYLKDEYAQIDSVKSISSDLKIRTGVEEVSYSEQLLRR